MQIQNIQNTSYYQKTQNPSFKSWTREVLMNPKNPDALTTLVKHRNDTWLYRDCVDWNRLCNFLIEKYKSIPKVNVYNYACSNGSEAYTFIMELFSNHDFATAKKFLPVTAKDYDQVAIDYAQSGLLSIEEGEKGGVNLATGGKFDLFFTPCNEYNKELYEAHHILTNNVYFSKANALEDYKNMPRNNIVVFVRNFWPYLKYQDRLDFAKNLYEHLDENATVIIGKFDNIGAWDGTPTRRILQDAGFRVTEIENVFVK